MGTGLRARAWRLVAIALALLLGLGLLPGAIAPTSVFGQADELSQGDFEELVEAAQEADPIYGPEDGELEHDPELVTFSSADVEVADFLATAAFVNPYAGSREQFDYGFQFRSSTGAGEVSYLRFIVLSSTDWGVTNVDGDVLVQGVYDDLDVGRNGENELTLYADGPTVHLGINGDYVGSVEVELEDAGEVGVGTSFFEESYDEGAVTEFFEFTVWEVASPGAERDDDSLGSSDDEPTPDEENGDGPPSGEDDEEPRPPDDAETPDDGDQDPTAEDDPTPTVPSPPDADEPTGTEAANLTRYESPTYGYAIEYDESWTVRTESSTDESDLFEISNGPSSLQFLGSASSETPNECISSLIARLRISEAVDSAEIALNEDDEEMRGAGETGAFAVLTVTYAGETGDPVVFGVYYGCYQIADRALLQVTHLALIDQYNDEIENRATVLATLDLDGDGEPDVESTSDEDVSPPAEDEETDASEEDEPTPPDDEPSPPDDEPAPPDEGSDGAVAVYLAPTTTANISAIGTMVSAGGRARITLFVVLGEPGADYVATIHTGSCAAPGPVELEVGSADASGLVETTVDADVAELSNGGYIMVLADAESPNDPAACGNLADLVER